MERSTITREPLYFDGGGGILFGWLHDSGRTARGDCVAVICPPVGSEYTRSHRSMRHLADAFARAGLPALRFDYPGSGDSAGEDLEPGRVEAWRRSVVAAIDQARAVTGCSRVLLAGVRLGGTLAVLAAMEREVDVLVLWNPVAKGRTFEREMQALAASAARTAGGSPGDVEGGGYLITAETAAALRDVDLSHATPRVRTRALLVSRGSEPADATLSRRLPELGIAVDTLSGQGWDDMMADNQFTEVPHETLAAIAEWAGVQADRASPPGPRADARVPLAQRAQVTPEAPGREPIEEIACRFGPGNALFGILGRTSPDPARTAVLLLNSGAVHHAGPHRLYTTLARGLAASGHATFRIDLLGLGDSVLEGAGRENHPYPDTATRDARAALDYLAREHGYRRFVVVGLCSGAHTAFHLAIEETGHAITDVVLINPLTFRWAEGMTLRTPRARTFADLNVVMRDPHRWLRVLTGRALIRKNVEVAVKHALAMARSHGLALLETLDEKYASPLARDLRRIIHPGRRILLFIAEGDPGYDLLLANARYVVRKAMTSRALHVEFVPGADHTFSQYAPRADFSERLYRLLAPASDPDRAE